MRLPEPKKPIKPLSEKEADEALARLVKLGFVKLHPGGGVSITEDGLAEIKRLKALEAN